MPKFNPKGPGDNFYPQREWMVTKEIAANTTINKGWFYSTDNAGRLIVPPAANNSYFQRGIFQATRTVEANAVAGANTVQCLAPDSFVGVEANVANLTAGDAVFWESEDKADLLTAALAANATHVFRRLGRVFRVFTRGQATFALEDGKRVSEAGDTLIVRLGLI